MARVSIKLLPRHNTILWASFIRILHCAACILFPTSNPITTPTPTPPPSQPTPLHHSPLHHSSLHHSPLHHPPLHPSTTHPQPRALDPINPRKPQNHYKSMELISVSILTQLQQQIATILCKSTRHNLLVVWDGTYFPWFCPVIGSCVPAQLTVCPSNNCPLVLPVMTPHSRAHTTPPPQGHPHPRDPPPPPPPPPPRLHYLVMSRNEYPEIQGHYTPFSLGGHYTINSP